jgi:hypothetical protein
MEKNTTFKVVLAGLFLMLCIGGMNAQERIDTVWELVASMLPIGYEIVSISPSGPDADTNLRRITGGEIEREEGRVVSMSHYASDTPISSAAHVLTQNRLIASLGRDLESYTTSEYWDFITGIEGVGETEARKLISMVASQSAVRSVHTELAITVRAKKNEAGAGYYLYVVYASALKPTADEIAQVFRTAAKGTGSGKGTAGSLPSKVTLEDKRAIADGVNSLLADESMQAMDARFRSYWED